MLTRVHTSTAPREDRCRHPWRVVEVSEAGGIFTRETICCACGVVLATLRDEHDDAPPAAVARAVAPMRRWP